MFPRISLGFFPRTRGPFRNSCCDFSEKFASTFTGLSAAVPIKNPPGRPPWVFFEASVRIPSDVFLRNFKFFFRDIPRNSLLVLLKKFFYGLLLELLQKCIWSSINPSYNNSIDVSTYLSRIFPWDSIFFYISEKFRLGFFNKFLFEEFLRELLLFFFGYFVENPIRHLVMVFLGIHLVESLSPCWDFLRNFHWNSPRNVPGIYPRTPPGSPLEFL